MKLSTISRDNFAKRWQKQNHSSLPNVSTGNSEQIFMPTQKSGGVVMKWFLVLMGIIWIVTGTLVVFTTDMMKKKFLSKFKNMNYKKWSFLPILIGILFLLSVTESSARILIVILGILAILKGVYFAVTPGDKVGKLVNWWLNAKDIVYKIWGIAVIILGALVLINL